MNKIIVTGATSFLASNFIKKITDEGYDVIAVVRENSDKIAELKKMQHVETVELNMQDYKALGEKTGTADVLVHFAWDGTRGEKRNNAILQAENYRYGLDAIKSVLNYGCKKIILSGSQAEYGNCDKLITEETVSNPNTEYGKYKLKLFNDAQDVCKEKEAILVEPRYFSMYGPGDYEGTLIMSSIKKMLKNEPLDLTDCTQVWNFLYVDDAINALIKLCTNDCASGIYNIASDDNRELKDYILEMKRVLNSNSVLNFGVIPYPPTGAVSINASALKIENATGWSPKTVFSEGINKIIT